MGAVKTAAVYCRISRDAEEEGLGVARQEADCRALVAKAGWTLTEVYVDNDISASSKKGRPRPRYDAMLEAVKGGQVDVIVAYSNSRLTRRLRELLDLIELHNETGVAIQTVVSGNDDLSTADGIMVAQIKGSVDEGEARRTGERLRRKFLEKAQRGAVNQGTRPFGWGDDKRTLHPKEARLLRKAVRAVIDGVPTREVARQWNEAGVTTVRGNAWNHTSVRQVLRSPRLAGWRVHLFGCARCDFTGTSEAVTKHQKKAGHTGRVKPIARDASGAPVRGEWKPLVDQDTFDALQAALDGRRPKERRGAVRYLLSTVLRCGVCGGRVHGFKTTGGGHTYACSADARPCVTIAGAQTDALVRLVVEQRLASVDLSGEAVAPVEWEGEARLRQVPGQIAELMAAFKAGRVSGAVTWPAISDLEAEQAALEKARPRAAATPAVATPEAFPGLDVDRQRAVVETLLEAVVVAKAAHRGARWTPDRLEIVWRS